MQKAERAEGVPSPVEQKEMTVAELPASSHPQVHQAKVLIAIT